MLRYEFPFMQKMSDLMLRMNNETALRRVSVKDIWWGYEDPILQEAAEIFKFLNISSDMVTGKFGFYMDRNNTGDGLWTVHSGQNGDFDDYLMVDRWNGLKKLQLWTTDVANSIHGTDGSQHPPQVTPDSHISMFDTNLFRCVFL